MGFDLIGRALSHYRIHRVLGVGGMGEVYRATDTRLGRDVALKVLPPDVANDPERLARFQREARAVAALNHPNVVTLYSVEEADGIRFLTMELIEGQSLDLLIDKDGLPVEQIVAIGGALAEALTAAHEKGILHRDLKPANVMVTIEGRVKVLDFGLAKDVGAERPDAATQSSAGRTRSGMVMGTPFYMSPEQVAGRPSDARTDIFSLGVVLYEMSTGQRPFAGASSAEVFSSILRDTPPSVIDVRPDLPKDLGRVIRRCLEKDPRRRLQTARDVSNEFREFAGQATPLVIPGSSSRQPAGDSAQTRPDEGFWVAVLPFKYLGSDPELAALADGLTDDIVTRLSRFSYLRVIARSSTARYARESVDVRAAATQLGARYVMEGSIRQAGARVRIAVQMIDASTGAGMWAETYDRPFKADAMFDLLDYVVPRIVATVADPQGVLRRNMSDALRHRNSSSFTPYEAFVRSFGYYQYVDAAKHAETRAALEQAIQQQPDHADCLAMLSWLYRDEYAHGFNLRPDPLGRAVAAARRAVDIAPFNHFAHAALASTLFFRHDLSAFRASADRSLTLNSLDGLTGAYLGFQIAFSGDWERGCALTQRVMDLNPHHPGWYWFPLVLNAYRLRDYQHALDLALRVNMPGFWRTQLMLAVSNAQLGNLDAGRVGAQELLRLRPNFAEIARSELQKWWWEPDLVDDLLAGLRKAGLDIAEDSRDLARRPPGHETGSGG